MKLHLATCTDYHCEKTVAFPYHHICVLFPAFLITGAFLTCRGKEDNLGNKGERGKIHLSVVQTLKNLLRCDV